MDVVRSLRRRRVSRRGSPSDKAGITARGYVHQFVRGFEPLQVLAPSALIQGGLAFTGRPHELPRRRRVRRRRRARAARSACCTAPRRSPSGSPTTSRRSRQGDGTQSSSSRRTISTRLPLLCPRIYDPTSDARSCRSDGCPLTFAFPAIRTVLGAYVNPQFRPNKKLIFDARRSCSRSRPTRSARLGYPLNATRRRHASCGTSSRTGTSSSTTPRASGRRCSTTRRRTARACRSAVTRTSRSRPPTPRRPRSTPVSSRASAAIRELSFRVDGSYTRLNNLIQITSRHVRQLRRARHLLGRVPRQALRPGRPPHRARLHVAARRHRRPRPHARRCPSTGSTSRRCSTLVTNKLIGDDEPQGHRRGRGSEPPRRVSRQRATTPTGDPTGSPVTVSRDRPACIDRLPPIAELVGSA